MTRATTAQAVGESARGAQHDENGDDDGDDDVPLAAMLRERQQRRAARLDRTGRGAVKNARSGASAVTGTRGTRAAAASRAAPARRRRAVAKPRTALQLPEVGERLILSFLPFLPERLTAEAVCKRWRRLTQELPVTELDFSHLPPRPHLRDKVLAMLQRANGALLRLVLPYIPLADAHIELIVLQRGLRVFRAHRMQKRHIFSVVRQCTRLETLELLDCQTLSLSSWPRYSAPLRHVTLRGCNFLTNQAVISLAAACGAGLKSLVLTETTNVNSQVFPRLAQHAMALEKLTMSCGNTVRARDLQVLVNALAQSLCWLNLSSCRGMSSFPDTPCLPQLEALILDMTHVDDASLQAIARVAPQLRYLSIQDCRNVSDDGIAAVAGAEGCTRLELMDLKGTNVTDASLSALESNCPRLRMVRIDSCRSVSRKMRHKYTEQARNRLATSGLSEFERIYADRKKLEMARVANSSDESDGDSESASEASDDEACDLQPQRRAPTRKRRR